MAALGDFGKVTLTVVTVDEDSIGENFHSLAYVGNAFRDDRVVVRAVPNFQNFLARILANQLSG
jgi:hypothetical protein